MEKGIVDKKGAQYSPLVLAYIGDSVHTLYIRRRLIDLGDYKVNDLHVMCSRYVCASAQSSVIMEIICELSEEETGVYKRGRNAKSYTVPKHATIADYRHATGFEALLGYLYIDKKNDRLDYILKRSFEIINAKEK